MMTEIRLLPLNQMARYLKVPAAWLKAEADAGRVPCLRAGNRYLFAPDAVEAALEQRARQTPTAGGEEGQQ